MSKQEGINTLSTQRSETILKNIHSLTDYGSVVAIWEKLEPEPLSMYSCLLGRFRRSCRVPVNSCAFVYKADERFMTIVYRHCVGGSENRDMEYIAMIVCNCHISSWCYSWLNLMTGRRRWININASC